MTDVLNVSLRDETGSRAARRLRSQGVTPAILYGHGKENVTLSVPTAELETALRHGSQMVDLSGGVRDTALIRSVQRDAFGTNILHLDLNRVSASETVVVTVPIELRGEAPGAKHGGIIEHHMHDVEIECPAGEIPEKLEINVKDLEIGDAISVGEISTPEHTTIMTADDTVVVSCDVQKTLAEEEEEAEEAAASSVEPEVIGRKEEEEAESE